MHTDPGHSPTDERAALDRRRWEQRQLGENIYDDDAADTARGPQNQGTHPPEHRAGGIPDASGVKSCEIADAGQCNEPTAAPDAPPLMTELAKLRRLQLARNVSLPCMLQSPLSSPGHPYVFNEGTGLLSSTGRGPGEAGARERKEYIEDTRTGRFLAVADQGPRFGCLQRARKQKQAWQEMKPEEGARLKAVVDRMANFTAVLAIFMQGTLGGLALLNFFMTYILGLPDWGGDLSAYLRYYAPLSMSLNRLYYGLIAISLITAVTRQANHAISSYEPRQLHSRRQGGALIACYLAAYIVSILCTPMDDELTYAYNRDPEFWTAQPLDPKFLGRLKLWHAMNVMRMCCCGAAWGMVCYQMRPSAHDAVISFKVREQLKGQRAARAPDSSPLRRAVLVQDRAGDAPSAVPMSPLPSQPRTSPPRPS